MLEADAAKIHTTFLRVLRPAPCCFSTELFAFRVAGSRAQPRHCSAHQQSLGVKLLLLHQPLRVDLYEKKPFIFANKDLMMNKASLLFFQAVNAL